MQHEVNCRNPECGSYVKGECRSESLIFTHSEGMPVDKLTCVEATEKEGPVDADRVHNKTEPDTIPGQ